jgi:hypothetical protein
VWEWKEHAAWKRWSVSAAWPLKLLNDEQSQRAKSRWNQ